MSSRRHLASASAPKLPLLINNQWIQSSTSTFLPVHNPATQELIAQVPVSTPEEMAHCSEAAAEAYVDIYFILVLVSFC
jgi:malonate-semialdehyde dehydrogenase (acetylating)/methylmalonate-semialdehyde dehydrogenase